MPPGMGGMPPGMGGMPGGGPGDPQAAAKVSLPSILMMVFAGLAILTSIAGILMNLLGAGIGAASSGGGSEGIQAIVSGIGGVVAGAFSILFNAVVLFGAMKMKKLESHTFALISAVLFALPCSVCCLINTPIGIWALITLLDQNVKAAFRS